MPLILEPTVLPIMSVIVGKPAPSFKASTIVNDQVVENFYLDQFKGEKYVILFFYPKGFTFVCPTELHAFQNRLAESARRCVEIIGVSTDAEMSHWGSLQVPTGKKWHRRRDLSARG